MDLSMPEVDGLDATPEVIAAHPGARVIAFSAHLDRALFERAFAAGAVGYVLKDMAHEELAAAIRAVAAGRTYISPRIARVLGVSGDARASDDTIATGTYTAPGTNRPQITREPGGPHP